MQGFSDCLPLSSALFWSNSAGCTAVQSGSTTPSVALVSRRSSVQVGRLGLFLVSSHPSPSRPCVVCAAFEI